jgi:hypothetical protein
LAEDVEGDVFRADAAGRFLGPFGFRWVWADADPSEPGGEVGGGGGILPPGGEGELGAGWDPEGQGEVGGAEVLLGERAGADAVGGAGFALDGHGFEGLGFTTFGGPAEEGTSDREADGIRAVGEVGLGPAFQGGFPEPEFVAVTSELDAGAVGTGREMESVRDAEGEVGVEVGEPEGARAFADEFELGLDEGPVGFSGVEPVGQALDGREPTGVVGAEAGTSGEEEADEDKEGGEVAAERHVGCVVGGGRVSSFKFEGFRIEGRVPSPGGGRMRRCRGGVPSCQFRPRRGNR